MIHDLYNATNSRIVNSNIVGVKKTIDCKIKFIDINNEEQESYIKYE